MPEKIKRWPPRKSVPRVPIENLPQDAIVEYWQWATARGWYLARSTDRPISLREAIAERRTHEVSIWKCSGHPVYGAADADAIEAFRAGLPRKLKAAILESTAVKVRKVWGTGRMTVECQRPRP